MQCNEPEIVEFGSAADAIQGDPSIKGVTLMESESILITTIGAYAADE